MALTNEDLLAISDIVDTKLKSELRPLRDDIQAVMDEVRVIKEDLHLVKLQQENVIILRLDTIESCYTGTYQRYHNMANRMETVYDIIDLLKKIVAENSPKLQRTG